MNFYSVNGLLLQDFYGDSGGGRRQDSPKSYSPRNNITKQPPKPRARGRTRAYDEPGNHRLYSYLYQATNEYNIKFLTFFSKN